MSREPEYIFFSKEDTWKDAQYHKSSWKCKSKSQWDTTLHLSEWLLSKIQEIHCWWECKLIQPLWKMVWRFLKKLGIKPPYGQRIPLLGICPEETKIERDTCIPLFITALFTRTRTWKQPRCPSTDELIKKSWYICTMEYYSAIKRNTFESVLMRWMNLEPIIQSEVSHKEKDNIF